MILYIEILCIIVFYEIIFILDKPYWSFLRKCMMLHCYWNSHPGSPQPWPPGLHTSVVSMHLSNTQHVTSRNGVTQLALEKWL